MKSKGKRKAVEADTLQGDPSAEGTQSRPQAGRGKRGDSQASLLWDQCPAGPFNDPLAIANGRRIRIGERSRPYLAPRAWRLPFSRQFLDPLEEDVNVLLQSFQTKCIISEGTVESACHHLEPFLVMLRIWEQRGWHLVQIAWGEDKLTRELFFEATTRFFVGRLKGLLLGEDRERSIILQTAACIFSLMLLFTSQSGKPNPEPGIKRDAFAWARRPDAVGDCDPFERHGRSRIKIEAGESGFLDGYEKVLQ